METSSTPERESRSRGKGRGKRGGRGSRSRGRSRGARSSSSRGRGSRSRGRGRGHLEEQREVGAFEIIQQRQESMREELSRQTREELQEILYETVGRYPSLMFDIMRPAQHQPGGYHPAP
ncbi:splicing factor Cactin-like [Ruditapes philippinarum]|uniref:splicing factor Cactin-like n=1 Tax=Ruditapes philippinarum TaxID=129788 RepID=UPI00295AE793|nr:splicing factor Cactin-like [Ruditapes philippinarum]